MQATAQVARDGDSSEEGLLLSGGTFFVGSGEAAAACFWGISAQSGKVAQMECENLEARSLLTVSTRGSPTGVVVDAAGDVLVSDVEHAAVLKADLPGNKFVPVVTEYEGQPLVGPSSIALGQEGTLFFTDSGPLGDSSLENPCGSVFAITREASGSILRPLALRCLAHPCGACVSPADDALYVAETLRNRVLRFARRPHGVYIASVLHQFSGRLGPSAIACDPDTGLLYVARYDFDAEFALISVLDPRGSDGGLVRDIEVPECGSQVANLTINTDSKELYVFEGNTHKVMRMPL